MGTDYYGNNEVESNKEKSSTTISSATSKFSKDLKEQRIKNLRNLKSSKTSATNIKAKLWALHLMDEICGKRAINLPGEKDYGSCKNSTRSWPRSRATLKTIEDSRGSTRATLKLPERSNDSSNDVRVLTRATLKPDWCGNEDLRESTRATLKAEKGCTWDPNESI